ncbi:MAG: pantoate--beta-alanine ligase [Flavobacteriales bacterium]|nr:pantoate--beta-alanine ligase [Bacteroidales bacterium AH-315-I05]PCJ89692.1 MAG: pantoate--beta-alanine ligase [Flavobacteriales bacterium]
MLVAKTKAELTESLSNKRTQGNSIGFVPTMGALHKGHLSLVKKARNDNNIVVVSIYVNPTQFNKTEDLKKYPRNLEKDLELLNKTHCDVVFAPKSEEMYPENEAENDLEFDFVHLDTVMEGQSRPGHFQGVATIVSKLFKAVMPHNAYFGEKDYQQLQIIKKLVDLQRFNINIIGCPIVREQDGLAMSSRNQLLSEEERKVAPFIYQTLKSAKTLLPEKKPNEIKKWVEKQFEQSPMFLLDYFEIVDTKTLHTISDWDDTKKAIGCVAAFLGKVRLIDNIIFA